MEQVVNLNNVSGNVLFVASLGQDMPTGVTYCQSSGEFTSSELAEALNGDFGSKITSGDIIVNDGTNNLSAADGINQIRTASRKYIDDRDSAISAAFAASDSTILDEINRIEAGAGLATDGQYITRTTSNYLNSATSLRQESTILDAQLKTANDSIVSLGDDLTDGLALKVDKAGDTMTGNLNMGSNEVLSAVSEPSSMNTLVNKAWVLTMMRGVTPKGHVKVATIDPLPACTYDNGISGVGATLTGDSTGSITPFDGAVLLVGDSILLAGQADSTENGVYEVTELGGIGTSFVLTRRGDSDGAPESELLPGSTYNVNAGNTWAGYAFYILGTSQVPRIAGVDTITFGQAPNSTATANVQGEIDAIEAALNLNTDGTFKAHVGTNYMDAASDAFAARVALDTQIKTNADDIAANTTAIANITQSLLNIAVYDGGVYAKDVSRNLWLGPRETYIFGRNGFIKSKYLSASAGIFSNLSSIRIDRAMAITSLSANLSEINSGTTYIQMRINGVPVDSSNYLSIVTATGETRIDLNVAVVENDVISVYIAGDGCADPIIKLTAAYAVPL